MCLFLFLGDIKSYKYRLWEVLLRINVQKVQIYLAVYNAGWVFTYFSFFILGYNSVASSKAYSLINARDILKMFLRGVLTLPLPRVYDGDSLRKCSQKAPSDISDRVLHTSLSSNELGKLIFLKDTLKVLDDFKNKQQEKKSGLFFDM